MQAEVDRKLDEIERQHEARVLYACECGGRAWGFASPQAPSFVLTGESEGGNASRSLPRPSLLPAAAALTAFPVVPKSQELELIIELGPPHQTFDFPAA